MRSGLMHCAAGDKGIYDDEDEANAERLLYGLDDRLDHGGEHREGAGVKGRAISRH
jgi:hypothetical protein